ncbi:hypothetical protein ABZ791_10620 [Streptomyces huasconensis]|uniref:Uncharacterized protein n=1 Tax=Streptomyces huasconensis TaxID=1854574 RepID=A0ABV3M7G1_9ACTN
MRTVLTDSQVLSALRQIAAESPEKVYEAPGNMRDGWDTCYYVHRDEDGTESPGCIVGQVLHRLGVPLADLKGVETLGAITVVQRITEGVSDGVAVFLREVQRKQDRGYAWGEAVADALEEHGGIHLTGPTLSAVGESAA